MKRKVNNTTATIAKGYRLRPETHKLIMKLQRKFKGTKDDAISRACNFLYGNIIDSKKTKKLLNKE